MKNLFLVIALLLSGLLCAGGNVVNFLQGEDTITWSTTDSLATATFGMPLGINVIGLEGIMYCVPIQYLDTQRVKITPTYALDSVNYQIKVFIYNGADSSAIVWLSPVQIYHLTPSAKNSTVFTYSFVFPDTTITLKDTSDGSGTVAEMCDSILLSIAADDTLNARITAEDSTTYVKLISKFGEITLGGKWTMSFDSLFTLDTASMTTIAMVCDSMKAYIDAESDVGDSISVDDSTAYIKTYAVEGGRPYTIRIDDTLQEAVTIDTAPYSKFGEGPDSIWLQLSSTDGINSNIYDKDSITTKTDTTFFYEYVDSLIHWNWSLSATWRATNGETPTATDSAYMLVRWIIRALETELK